MSTDFRPGDVVRRKSGGQDVIIIKLEDENAAGAKKLAFCGRFEGQSFREETIPLDLLEFVSREFGS